MSVWVAIVAILVLVVPPLFTLFIFRREGPMTDRYVKITCYICDRQILVSRDDPYPEVDAHIKTGEHKRNMGWRDA